MMSQASPSQSPTVSHQCNLVIEITIWHNKNRKRSTSEPIGLESAIALYSPSLSPIITRTVLHVAPRLFTTFPIKSINRIRKQPKI